MNLDLQQLSKYMPYPHAHVISLYPFIYSDGVHGAQASCRLELTPISIEMMANGVSVNVLNVTEDNFLRSFRLNALRDALAHTLNSHANQLVIFNLQEVCGSVKGPFRNDGFTFGFGSS